MNNNSIYDETEINKPGNSRLWRLVAAIFLSVLTMIGSDWAPNLLPYDSSVSDYFRLTRANRVADQRISPPDITLVMVGEHFINQLPYRSPVDRCVLAAGISSVMTLNPKVVGVDFLFDKNTESHKDDMLREVIQDNRDNLVIAVNTTNSANTDIPHAEETEDSFSPDEIQASALLVKDPDYVVRNALLDDEGVPAYAARLVYMYGKSLANTQVANEFQIDWLARDSGRGDAFSLIPLELFLDQSVNEKCAVNLDLPAEDTRQYLRRQIENKIVIIGADLEREDRHITPFDSVWHEQAALSGAEIHANIAQQLIDGRRIGNIHWALTFILLCASFYASLWTAAVFNNYGEWGRVWLLLGPILLSLLLSLASWTGIYYFGYILPTGLVAFAIVADVLLEFSKGIICDIWDKCRISR